MSSRSEQATATSLTVIGLFQVALAAGAPWGQAAYGGAHRGTLPVRLRAVSAAAGVAYGTGAALVWSDVGSPRARRRGFTGLSMFMAVGALVNGASRSAVERTLWTPLTAATAVSCWRSRPTAGTPRTH